MTIKTHPIKICSQRKWKSFYLEFNYEDEKKRNVQARLNCKCWSTSSLGWDVHVIRFRARLFTSIVVHSNLLLRIVVSNSFLRDLLQLSLGRPTRFRWTRWRFLTRRWLLHGTLCSWPRLRILSLFFLLAAMRLLLPFAAVTRSWVVPGLGAMFATSRAKPHNWIYVRLEISFTLQFTLFGCDWLCGLVNVTVLVDGVFGLCCDCETFNWSSKLN